MKEPSLHITRSNLTKILKEWEFKSNKGIDIDSLVKFLLKNGSIYKVYNRSILEFTNKKTYKRAVQQTISKQEDVVLMAKTIYYIRKAQKHRGIALTKEGDAQWRVLKEVTSLATRFCEDFELEIESGYKIYIQTYNLIKTKSFNLSVINNRHEYICETYEAQLRIQQDAHSTATREAYDEYQKIIEEMTGNNMRYDEKPTKYVAFIEVVDVAKELNLSPKQFVQAQFDKLAWKNGIPTAASFVSDSARERAIIWMGENNVKTASSSNQDDVTRKLYADIKKRMDNEHNS